MVADQSLISFDESGRPIGFRQWIKTYIDHGAQSSSSFTEYYTPIISFITDS